MGETTARTIRVDDELWEAATRKAAEINVSVSEVIRSNLQQFADEGKDFYCVTAALHRAGLLPLEGWSEGYQGKIYVTYPALLEAMNHYAALSKRHLPPQGLTNNSAPNREG